MELYVFGVDVGGTTVKLGCFTAEGSLLDKWEIPTRTANGGEAILPDVAASIKEKMQEKGITKEQVVGVGIGAPGPIDERGIVHSAVNLGWGQFDVNDTLSELLDGMRVKATNDANAAALGEMWKGGGQGYQDVIAVTLGTGVGGGLIVNGKILCGAVGASGEIGHIHVEDAEEERCNCGNYGCLEQYASATGVVRIAKRVLASCEDDSVLRSGELSAKAVFDAVKAGDAVAIKIADRFGYYLGKGLAVVSAIIDPEIFVVGGGVSKAGEVLFEYIKPYYLKYAFHASKEVEFRLAMLGNDAGIYGAAKMMID